MEEYGESHYDAFNQPHLYFQMLALTGQFEAAFEFLARIEKFKVHAVHMAIAMNELYMLGPPGDPGSPLRRFLHSKFVNCLTKEFVIAFFQFLWIQSMRNQPAA